MFGQCLGIDTVGHGCTGRDILMHLNTVLCLMAISVVIRTVRDVLMHPCFLFLLFALGLLQDCCARTVLLLVVFPGVVQARKFLLVQGSSFRLLVRVWAFRVSVVWSLLGWGVVLPQLQCLGISVLPRNVTIVNLKYWLLQCVFLVKLDLLAARNEEFLCA